jgi:hypothetical protein
MIIRYLTKGRPGPSSTGKESDYEYASAISRRCVTRGDRSRKGVRNYLRFIHSGVAKDGEICVPIEPGKIRLMDEQLLWRDAPACFPRVGAIIKDQETIDFLIHLDNDTNTADPGILDGFELVYAKVDIEILPFISCFGDKNTAALFSNVELHGVGDKFEADLGIDYVICAITANKLNSKALMKHLYGMFTANDERAQSLKALAIATDVFKLPPGATISLEVAAKPLHETHWIMETPNFGVNRIVQNVMVAGHRMQDTS